jgi:hypothetical protein
VQKPFKRAFRPPLTAHNALLNLEELEEHELDAFRAKHEDIAAKARLSVKDGRFDTDSPEA